MLKLLWIDAEIDRIKKFFGGYVDNINCTAVRNSKTLLIKPSEWHHKPGFKLKGSDKNGYLSIPDMIEKSGHGKKQQSKQFKKLSDKNYIEAVLQSSTTEPLSKGGYTGCSAVQ